MVLAIGFLLLVSLVLSVALAALGKFFGQILPAPEFVLNTINFVVSFAGVSVLFGLIFKYVPETKIAWKDVPVGAIVTAFLFTVGKFLIGLYLGKAGVASAYGAAGSLIAVIVWVYYSSMIFFFGAEFTHVLAHPQRTRKIKPSTPRRSQEPPATPQNRE
jgi:membrane protein